MSGEGGGAGKQGFPLFLPSFFHSSLRDCERIMPIAKADLRGGALHVQYIASGRHEANSSTGPCLRPSLCRAGQLLTQAPLSPEGGFAFSTQLPDDAPLAGTQQPGEGEAAAQVPLAGPPGAAAGEQEQQPSVTGSLQGSVAQQQGAAGGDAVTSRSPVQLPFRLLSGWVSGPGGSWSRGAALHACCLQAYAHGCCFPVLCCCRAGRRTWGGAPSRCEPNSGLPKRRAEIALGRKHRLTLHPHVALPASPLPTSPAGQGWWRRSSDPGPHAAQQPADTNPAAAAAAAARQAPCWCTRCPRRHQRAPACGSCSGAARRPAASSG